jgi:hypothetical protein
LEEKPVLDYSELDATFESEVELERGASPLGTKPPVKRRLGYERNSTTVKFEIYSNDEYASMLFELDALRKDSKMLRGLLGEALEGKSINEFVEWCKKTEKVLQTPAFKSWDLEQSARKVKGYFNIGTYEDGYPGEIFINAGKPGDETHGWLNSFGKALSLLLQYSVPLDKIYSTFSKVRFDPKGLTIINETASIYSSILDMVMEYLNSKYMPTDDSDGDDGYLEMINSITDSKSE